jgi:hypothetical protein
MDVLSIRVWRGLGRDQVFIYENDSRRTLLCNVTGEEAIGLTDRLELLPLGYVDTKAEIDENGFMSVLAP